MKEALEKIRTGARDLLANADSEAALEELRVRFLGKKGEVTAILKQMGALSADERPKMGALANEVRAEIDAELRARSTELANRLLAARLASESIDVTLPGNRPEQGKRHPFQQVLDELKDIFLGMGFEVKAGPEIEYDHYNFEMLNMPRSHPARDTQDTFYITENILLRTQTSPMQVRTMEAQKPPIRIICPGRVYRSDEVDATHSPVFHQMEGLVVDEHVRMSDLRGTLEAFAKKLYGPDITTRFRPSFFPFTEPSAEVDLTCVNCHGKGCRICKGTGWIEVLGSGMVNPKVLEMCGIDPAKYSGFAFGIGLERIAMQRYGIRDMRLLYEGDARLLGQLR